MERLKGLVSYPLLARNVSTLKETSIDDENRQYMTESDAQVVAFDRVKEAYIRQENCVSEKPSSVDAVFEENGGIVFVEFKNGRIREKEKHQIRKKVYDSLLIYCDITNETIAKLRGFARFILVYNAEKNVGTSIGDTGGDKRTTVKGSESFDYIADKSFEFAAENRDRFGMKISFETYCFKEVLTLDQSQFLKHISSG